jgi:hypothetical protein
MTLSKEQNTSTWYRITNVSVHGLCTEKRVVRSTVRLFMPHAYDSTCKDGTITTGIPSAYRVAF